jgi:aminopeptidase-like protein
MHCGQSDFERNTYMNTNMRDIIHDLTGLNRVFCSAGYDRAAEYLGQLLPFSVRTFGASAERNGWAIPPRWDVTEAYIKKDGRLLFDGTLHPLRVIALSIAFEGTVPVEELKKHLYFDARYEDAVPFHFRQLYRSWDRDWGFCVPKTFYDSLGPGEYEVVIRTEESDGELKLLEYTKPGALDHTIMFAAHLDHPGMANDDLAGCAVGVELMRRLAERDTKFSYSLLLHQEVIGAEYYLASLGTEDRMNIIEGCFLEMLGTETAFGLQAPMRGTAHIEAALRHSLKGIGAQHRSGSYGSIVINGEYVWQSYGIPMASLSRYPYPEYHTDRDNESIISDAALDESLSVVVNAIEYLESSPVLVKNFEGTVCLANPEYDLYVDPGQAAFGGGDPHDRTMRLRFVMERIPAMEGPVPVRRIADEAGLPVGDVYEYLERWEKKGLVRLV